MFDHLPIQRILLPDGTPYDCWVASSPQDRYNGLRGVSSLPERTGMLLVQPEGVQIIHITMSGCLIPLDLVWLVNSTVELVYLCASPSMDSFGAEGDCVLELPPRASLSHGVKVGTKIVRV